jgi:two-component system, OmpR family, phosphate regulon response regulator PhoB
MMARRLGDAGYRMIACGSGVEAVSELYRAPVDLVIAELRMSAMSGIELTRMMRDDSVLRDIPVILINGRSDSDGTCEGLAAGADDIIAKPFDFDVLAAKIARALTRARAMRELRQDNATLDARVISRAIELSDLRDALNASENERRRLSSIVRLPD